LSIWHLDSPGGIWFPSPASSIESQWWGNAPFVGRELSDSERGRYDEVTQLGDRDPAATATIAMTA